MLEQLILISASLVGMGDGKVELPISTAVEKLNNSLKVQFGESLRNNVCSPLFFDADLIGFEASINEEKIIFDLDGYLMEKYKEPYLYASDASELTALDVLISKSGFRTASCVSQITSLADKPKLKEFGNWTSVSFNSLRNECAQIAAMDLIYTYKLSGRGKPSIYSSSTNLLETLKRSQKYQDGSGTSLNNFLPGLNEVLSSDFYAKEGVYNGTEPVICAYSPESGNLGHIAMKIGEAETSFMQIFKTKWDIIVSTKQNFYGKEPETINKTIESCFFGVQSNRRQATFVLSGC